MMGTLTRIHPWQNFVSLGDGRAHMPGLPAQGPRISPLKRAITFRHTVQSPTDPRALQSDGELLTRRNTQGCRVCYSDNWGATDRLCSKPAGMEPAQYLRRAIWLHLFSVKPHFLGRKTAALATQQPFHSGYAVICRRMHRPTRLLLTLYSSQPAWSSHLLA